MVCYSLNFSNIYSYLHSIPGYVYINICLYSLTHLQLSCWELFYSRKSQNHRKHRLDRINMQTLFCLSDLNGISWAVSHFALLLSEPFLRNQRKMLWPGLGILCQGFVALPSWKIFSSSLSWIFLTAVQLHKFFTCWLWSQGVPVLKDCYQVSFPPLVFGLNSMTLLFFPHKLYFLDPWLFPLLFSESFPIDPNLPWSAELKVYSVFLLRCDQGFVSSCDYSTWLMTILAWDYTNLIIPSFFRPLLQFLKLIQKANFYQKVALNPALTYNLISKLSIPSPTSFMKMPATANTGQSQTLLSRASQFNSELLIISVQYFESFKPRFTVVSYRLFSSFCIWKCYQRQYHISYCYCIDLTIISINTIFYNSLFLDTC